MFNRLQHDFVQRQKMQATVTETKILSDIKQKLIVPLVNDSLTCFKGTTS